MRKFWITFILLITIVAVFHAQDNKDFKIVIENRIISSSDCLSENDNFRTLKIQFDRSTADSVSLVLRLMNQKNEMNISIDVLNSSDVKFWLLEHQAFQRNESISFELTFINGNVKSVVQKEICLLDSNISQSENYNMVNPPRKTRGSYSDKSYIIIPINFATDRNFIATNSVNEQFGPLRGNELRYGVCKVSIPKVHEIGEIERPSFWRFEFSEDPKKHIVIQENKVLPKEFFFNQLKERINKSKKKSSFLFIHGYNVSFADAARRTAQISYDLKFDGEPVFYSWPSKAEVTGYMADEVNIQWAQSNIKNFIVDYLTKSGAEEVFLVAHSMGNRGLTRAIIDVITEYPELKSKIKEIILAAPDIDADVFKRDIAPKMVSLIQKPITLYVSSDDLALDASKKIHGYPRAGDSSEGLMLVKGIETIDASGIDTSFLSHSYFADTSSIIQDIFNLIETGYRASKRGRLKLMELRDNIYWRVVKE